VFDSGKDHGTVEEAFDLAAGFVFSD